MRPDLPHRTPRRQQPPHQPPARVRLPHRAGQTTRAEKQNQGTPRGTVKSKIRELPECYIRILMLNGIIS